MILKKPFQEKQHGCLFAHQRKVCHKQPQKLHTFSRKKLVFCIYLHKTQWDKGVCEGFNFTWFPPPHHKEPGRKSRTRIEPEEIIVIFLRKKRSPPLWGTLPAYQEFRGMKWPGGIPHGGIFILKFIKYFFPSAKPYRIGRKKIEFPQQKKHRKLPVIFVRFVKKPTENLVDKK